MDKKIRLLIIIFFFVAFVNASANPISDELSKKIKGYRIHDDVMYYANNDIVVCDQENPYDCKKIGTIKKGEFFFGCSTIDPNNTLPIGDGRGPRLSVSQSGIVGYIDGNNYKSSVVLAPDGKTFVTITREGELYPNFIKHLYIGRKTVKIGGGWDHGFYSDDGRFYYYYGSYIGREHSFLRFDCSSGEPLIIDDGGYICKLKGIKDILYIKISGKYDNIREFLFRYYPETEKVVEVGVAPVGFSFLAGAEVYERGSMDIIRDGDGKEYYIAELATRGADEFNEGYYIISKKNDPVELKNFVSDDDVELKNYAGDVYYSRKHYNKEGVDESICYWLSPRGDLSVRYEKGPDLSGYITVRNGIKRWRGDSSGFKEKQKFFIEETVARDGKVLSERQFHSDEIGN